MTKDKQFEMIAECIINTHNELLIKAWERINSLDTTWAENATVAEVARIERGCSGDPDAIVTDLSTDNH